MGNIFYLLVYISSFFIGQYRVDKRAVERSIGFYFLDCAFFIGALPNRI